MPVAAWGAVGAIVAARLGYLGLAKSKQADSLAEWREWAEDFRESEKDCRSELERLRAIAETDRQRIATLAAEVAGLRAVVEALLADPEIAKVADIDAIRTAAEGSKDDDALVIAVAKALGADPAEVRKKRDADPQWFADVVAKYPEPPPPDPIAEMQATIDALLDALGGSDG